MLEFGIEDTQVHIVGAHCSSDSGFSKCWVQGDSDFRSFVFKQLRKLKMAPGVRSSKCAGAGAA
eukprot:13560488-Alexandrium_andersonii.AAC.1